MLNPGRLNSPILEVVVNHLSTLPFSVIAATIFINLLEMALPLAILQIYDRVIPNGSYETLTLIAVGLAVIVLIEATLKILRAYILSFRETQKGFRKEIESLRDVLRSPPSALAAAPSTVWLARMDALAERHDQYTGPISIQLIDLPFTILFLGLIACIGGTIVFVPILIILGSMIFLYYRGRTLKDFLGEQVMQGAKKFDFLNETLTNIETVKAFAIEERILRRFESLQKVSSLTTYNQVSTSGSIQVLCSMTGLITTVATLTIGTLMIINGYLTIGALACCTLLIGRSVGPIAQGIGLWSEIQNLLILEKRILPLHDLSNQLQPSHKIDDCCGSIHVSNLCIAEQSSSHHLDETSFKVAPGEMVCLSGNEGSGIRLVLMALLGDLKDYNGSVHIDGYNIRSGFENIKDHIGYVGPNPTLFDGTIFENLTMFQTDIDLEQIFYITALIGLDEQINKLPHGYHTKLGGNHSYVVSPGLHQKIAIARTLIRRTPILILENISTHMNEKDTLLVSEGLQLIKGQTTIVISDNARELTRLSDRLIIFNNGKIESQKLVYYKKRGEAL